MEGLVTLPDSSFWRGKRVLLTGHTGFKGAWLAHWLLRLGAKVTGIALPPATEPSLFQSLRLQERIDSHFCDIREPAVLADRVRSADPEVVFHLAAQPLVRAGYREPIETFATNVMGTAHLLEAVRRINGVRVVVVVTTDKVYHNLERPNPYQENAALGGHDPYSASKAACEMVAACYRSAFLRDQGVALATARAGNVIGGGDWSEDRLIPDAIRAWQEGNTLRLRRPQAVRPWQHVLEPLAGYLRLAEQLWQVPLKAGAYNFGPNSNEVATVHDVAQLARVAYGRGEIKIGDAIDGPREAVWLALAIEKARVELGIEPRWNLATAVNRTMNWYRRLTEGENAGSLCEADIDAYELKQ